jgi:hypothetical protein
VFHANIHENPGGTMFLVQCKGITTIAALTKAVCKIANHSFHQLAHRAIVFND